jgi:hypothetical protein
VPNPGGANQFGGYELQRPYGDAARQTQLLKQAPISGAPVAAHALEAPRRGRRHAQGQDRPAGTAEAQQQGQPQGQPQAPAFPAPTQRATSAMTWSQIAEIPGASPLVQQLALEALRLLHGA